MAQQQDLGSSKLFPIFQKKYRPQRPGPLHEIQRTLEKSELVQKEGAKKRRCLLGNKETPGLTQLVLDAGQKVFGPVTCEDCGLLFSPGDIEDEKEHRKAHARLDNLYSIRLWKNPTVVHNFPAEYSLIVEVNCKIEARRVHTTLRDFLEWIDSELGGVSDGSGTKPSEKIYLYLFRTKRKNLFRILGCCIVEVIEEERVTVEPLDISMQENAHKPLLLGITRLWTDATFRRKQIARRLCDTIRMTSSIPGLIIPKDQLGILEPSEDGKAFMLRYTEGIGRLYTYK